MTTAARAGRTHRALGIDVRLEDGLQCPGLGAASGTGGAPTTRVLRSAGPWDATGSVVTRELVDRGRLAFRVEHAEGRGYRLTMPEVGTYVLDEDGTRIACAVEHGVDRNGIGLLTQALPLAATLLGVEPFHAAGVVVDGRGALIGGPVGAGKSSVALHLALAGADLLADDVTAVTCDATGPVAHAGARLLRVRDGERRALPDDLGRLEVVDGLGSRLQLAVPVGATDAPLRAVYQLERAQEPGPALLDSSASGIDLLALTYNLSVVAPERRIRQLEVCRCIAERAAIRRAVVRPGQTASELAAAILADLRDR